MTKGEKKEKKIEDQEKSVKTLNQRAKISNILLQIQMVKF